MRLVDLVRNATQLPLVTEDGDPSPLKLAPGLSDAEVDELAATLPCPVPAEVRELLRTCSGFSESPLDIVDFTGRDCDYGDDSVFPHAHSIAGDGFGNFWVVDLLPESTLWGPIWFACHDAPVILYQCATLEEFLNELVKFGQPPHKSLIDDVHEDRLFNVWGKNPRVIEHADAMASNDRVIRDFAQELGPAFQIIDLRTAKPGMGFSWGRYGPRTEVRRCGDLPIWAYARPEKKPGLLGRLFGRS
jgi:hypothetical protein